MGTGLLEHVSGLIKEVWEKEVIPDKWQTSLIYPIHKKGDKQVCDNYRGIALLNVTYKVLSKCILNRVKSWAEDILWDYQAGLRQNISTTDQIFILKQIFPKNMGV